MASPGALIGESTVVVVRPSAAKRAVAAVMVLWIVVAVSGVWWIATERFMETGAQKCERVVTDQSQYGSKTVFGDARWSWLPPGRRCEYTDGVTTRPGPGRAALVVAIVGSVPLVVVAAVGSRKRIGAPSPARTVQESTTG